MIQGAAIYRIGGFPGVELRLESSEGLRPLELPPSLLRPLRQPSEDAVTRFRKAYFRSVPPEASELQAAQCALAACAVLRSGAAAAAEPAAPGASAADNILQIADAVAARASAASAPADSCGTIVLRLGRDVLDGSEIRIDMEYGELTVTITPATPEAARAVEGNLARLQASLAARVPAFRRVAVKTTKGKSDETK